MPIDDVTPPDEPALPVGSSASSNELPGVINALGWLSRLAWFAMGALVASLVALVLVLKPWVRSHPADDALPYESFPFTDNAGVCQEYVALATVATSHDDAQSAVRRLASSLPVPLRTENLRVVRAFSAGDRWSIAVDAQSGTGTMDGARATAAAMNAIAGTGLHFEPTYYASRRLYETASVLCMPRRGVERR